MAGIAGFEPAHDGIKTRCLTAWRYPSNFSIIAIEDVSNHLPQIEARIFPEAGGNVNTIAVMLKAFSFFLGCLLKPQTTNWQR